MRITETAVHATDPWTTYEMLTDPGYQELRCRRSGATDQTVSVESQDGATVVTTRRHLPSDGVPDFARAFVGPTLLLVETVRWGAADQDGEREAAVSLELPGLPVSFTGGTHLRRGAREGTTEQVVDGDLEAGVPLLGHRIEKAVAPRVSEIMRIEQEAAREWLAAR